MYKQDDSDLQLPKIAVLLLEWIYPDDLFNDIYGDLHELHIDRLRKYGRKRAKLYSILDAVYSVRNIGLRKKTDTSFLIILDMFSNYFKSTFRNISKNWTYSLLNIFGLALGIAACLFILQYVSYERSYDKFHANYDDIYRVLYKVYRGGELNIDCAAAVPRVGPFMKENMPEVIHFTRAFPMDGIITYEDKGYRETRLHIVDPSFLNIFSFPLISGDPASCLNEPYQVVITEEIAQKIFGNEEPIGKVIQFNGRDDLQVTGVAKNLPNNTHFKFNYLISYATINAWNQNDDGTPPSSETSWGWYDFNTYVQLQPGTNPLEFDQKFDQLVVEERREAFEEYNFKSEFPLQAIADIHLYSNLLQESEPEEQGDGRAVELLTLIAFFILLIAWINYINLATARSTERSREVGVRKTLGAQKKQLITQFLTESFTINFISLVLAILIVFLGIRWFNQLTESQLSLSFLNDPLFWVVIIGILLGGALISGIYPALILSSFKPVAVIKGKIANINSNNLLRKGLVVFQFVASIGLIAGTIVVYQQLAHLRSLDLGFNMTNLMVVRGPRVIEVDSMRTTMSMAFKDQLSARPNVEHVTSGSNIPGDEIFWTNSIRRDNLTADHNKIIYNISVDYDYFNTYDINIVAGRNYGEEFGMDTSSIILNAEAISYLGFSSPEEAVNDKVNFWGRPWTIVGVVDNYNQMTAKDAISPMAFHLRAGDTGYYTLRLSNSNARGSFQEVRKLYNDFFPGNPFEYFFLDEFYNRQYNNDLKFSRVFTLFACFAIFVACLGLFGLSSFNILKRSKEISIRKVLGAKVSGIVGLLSKEFIWLIVIANIIAWPLVYMMMSQWLNNFESRIQIGPLPFIVSGALVTIIALMTISYKIVQAAWTDPVHAMRDE